MSKKLNLKYYGDLIIQPNPCGDVAIVCGWTKREKLFETLSKDVLKRVGAIGQLYSREGVNYIIRNIFLNPSIRYIIISGLDLSGSLGFFKEFLQGSCSYEGIIQKEIQEKKLRRFINWFKSHHLVTDQINLNDVILSTPVLCNWIDEPLDFPDPPYQEASNFPSESLAFRIEDKKVADLWLKVLDRILKFGRDKKSQYGDMQRELVGMITVISDENPDNFFLPNFLTFGEKELSGYLNQILTGCIPEGLEYTYGSRLRCHGERKIDQIQSIINQINSEDYTRRAVAVTWNVEMDDGNPKAPCLDLIQAIISNGKIHLVCYIRSNDMYGAWPQNAMAMRAVQNEIALATNKEIGKLAIISTSAHIYERDYEKALMVVKKNKPSLECLHDPRGNFVITIEEGLIKVVHLDPEGRSLQEFKGKSANDVFHLICSFISDTLHALYLGGELQKAEIALKQCLSFEQDNPLKF